MHFSGIVAVVSLGLVAAIPVAVPPSYNAVNKPLVIPGSLPTTARQDRKCSPTKWESFVLMKVAQQVQGKGAAYDVAGMYAADYGQGKDVLYEEVFAAGKQVASYTFLRTPDATYLIDRANKSCSKSPATKVEQICTDSPGLTYIGSWTLGTQQTDTYAYNSQGRSSILTMFRDTFTIATESMEQVFMGVPQVITSQFGNTTTTITDPSVFDVPSFC